MSERRSSYVEAGSPTSCILPSCRRPFEDRCVRGDDGHFYCSQRCKADGKKLDLSKVALLQRRESANGGSSISSRTAQIGTVCECIDHCFSFSLWCEDFARRVDPEDMTSGLHRAFDVISDATRLKSFLALRKLDAFLGGGAKPQSDDLTAAKLRVDARSILSDTGATLLSETERTNINKGAAHLTNKLTLDRDSEVDLEEIVNRSTAVFTRLVADLRSIDTGKEAEHWLARTEALIERAKQSAQAKTEAIEKGEPWYPIETFVWPIALRQRGSAS